MQKNKQKIKASTVLIYIFFVFMMVIYLAPLCWIGMTSLKTRAEIYKSPFGWPESFQWGNYAVAWKAGKLGIAMLATLRGIPQLFSGDEMMFRASGGRNNDGAKRIDFPGGWDGDAFDLFTPEGRSEAGVDGLYEYSRALFNWRRDCPVLHQGKTIHFMTRDNTYAYFRYDDSSKVFVYINNSTLEHKVPWSRYSEVVSGPAEGVDPVTGASVTLSDSTLVPAKTALIVELLPTSQK